MTTLTAPTDASRANPEAPDRAACTHCGLPVPRGLVDATAEHQFCCEGCRAVYTVIHGCGLDQYYRLREAVDDAERAPARVSGRAYREFDEPSFHDLYASTLDGGLKQIDLYLDGVHCGACVWLVEKIAHLVNGVIEVKLDIRRHVARIAWDDSVVALSEIARRLDRLGYAPHPWRGRSTHAARRAEDRRYLIRLAVAGAAAGNVMGVSFALYGGMFHEMEREFFHLFRWSALAITLVTLLWPGRVFFRGAIAAIRTRTMHMDLPIAVGLATGAVSGAINTVRGTGEVYFDSVAVLVFLLLAGRWIQLRQQRASHDAVEMLYSMTPSTARLVEDDATTRDVPVEVVTPGDLVEVRAGESVPADGVIVDGASSVDLSILTGESRPAGVAAGDEIHAGTTSISGRLRIRVSATGEATRVGRLMRLVEESARRKAPVVRLANRIAGWFVAVVLLLAAATAIGWSFVDPAGAVEHSMALLIVTCPCALGLATPLAIIASIGRAARRDILIKGGEVLEQLTTPGLILLDKTGTLTRGEMTLVEWHGPEELKPLVAALERQSAHPVARAIADGLAESHSDGVDIRALETTGGGVEGVIDGSTIVVGSRAFIEHRSIAIPTWAEAAETRLVDAAHSPVFVARDGVVAAIAGAGDAVHPDAADAVTALRRRGWRVGVLSGDHPDVVRAVAAQIGIDAAACEGGATPERKLARVEAAARSGAVVMIGDGVNDAAALAAATVGVAVRGGAEASLAAADVYLGRAGLSPLLELLDGSRRTVGVIRRNLIASLGYNVIGATLAITGVLNPLLAAVLMPMSSLTVIAFSYRSRTFG